MSGSALIDRFEPRTFRDGRGELRYRLLKPKHYRREERYPLVLFLHGAGEVGDDNTSQIANGAERFATDDLMTLRPCFVVVPQCPPGEWWSGIDGKPSPVMKLVFALLDALGEELSLDGDRRYITGVSMGGFGVWDAVMLRPDYFAAALPVCGGGDPDRAYLIADLPVWAFHGQDDLVVVPEHSQRMIEAMRRAGGDPLYTELPGIGHESWNYVYSDPEALDWLFSQERRPARHGTKR